MSLTIFAIAVAPAVAVAVVATHTNSRIATALAALIAAGIGVFTGSAHYMLLDVSAVAIATWVFWPDLSQEKKGIKAAKKREQEAYYSSEKYRDDIKKIDIAVKMVCLCGIIGYTLWVFWPARNLAATSLPSALPQVVNSTPQNPDWKSSSFDSCKGSYEVEKCEALERKIMNESPAEASSRRLKLERQRSRAMQQVAGGQSSSDKNIMAKGITGTRVSSPEMNPNIEGCLKIPSEREMLACLEKVQ